MLLEETDKALDNYHTAKKLIRAVIQKNPKTTPSSSTLTDDSAPLSYTIAHDDLCELITCIKQLHQLFLIKRDTQQTYVDSELEPIEYDKFLNQYQSGEKNSLENTVITAGRSINSAIVLSALMSTSLIVPAVIMAKRRPATPAPSIIVPAELLSTMTNYLRLFKGVSSANTQAALQQGRDLYRLVIRHQLSRKKANPFTTLSDLPVETMEQEVGKHLLAETTNPLDELKRQAFLRTIESKSIYPNSSEKTVKIKTLAGEKVSRPVSVAQMYRRLLLEKDPKKAVDLARAHPKYARFFTRKSTPPEQKSTAHPAVSRLSAG